MEESRRGVTGADDEDSAKQLALMPHVSTTTTKREGTGKEDLEGED